MKSDDALLKEALAGNRDSMDELLERYRGQIFRYLAAMVGDEAEAEDLVQEAFRRAYENLSRYEHRGKFSSWLYQIAVNLARNLRRNRARHAKPGHQTEIDQVGTQKRRRRSVLSSIVRRETAEQLAMAVERLPPSLREAFALHYVEGLDYDEIEKITEVSARTLYVRAHRAKSLLRQQLGSVVDTAWAKE